MNIHSLLDHGDIVASDEAVDIIITYNEEARELVLFQGDTSGNYEIANTVRDVDSDEESIDEAIDAILDVPE